jgi:hypothetical protein
MGQVVLTVIGAVIGNTVAPGLGASIGAAIGSYVGAAIFSENQTGPRLSDLRVQNSSYGAPIPFAYGTYRMAGNVIWATDLHEHEHNSDGKGGPGITNYTYSVSFAVSICEGPIFGIRRVWADGRLIIDNRPGAEHPVTFHGVRHYIYLGDEEQTPNSVIEAFEGAGNVPAYRGQAYIVFEEMELEIFSNRIPNLSFEIVTQGTPISQQPGTLTPFGNSSSFIARDPVTGYIYSPFGPNVLVYNPVDLTLVDTIVLPPAYTGAAQAPDGIVYSSGNMIIGAGTPNLYGHVGWSIDCATRIPTLLNGQRTLPFGGAFWVPGIPSKELLFFGVAGLAGGASWDTYGNVDGAPNYGWMTGATLSPSGGFEVFWLNSQNYRLLINLANSLQDGWSFVWEVHNPQWPHTADAAVNAIDGTLIAFNEPQEMLYWGNKEQEGIFSVAFPTLIVKKVLDVSNPSFLLYSPDSGKLYVQSHGFAFNPGYFDRYTKQPDGTFVLDRTFPTAAITPHNGTHNTSIYIGNETWIVSTSLGNANNSLWKVSFPAEAGGTVNTAPVTLASIVRDISLRAGLTDAQINVEQLTDLVDGYGVGGNQSARPSIESLMQCYFFDAVESDSKVKFVKRGGSSIVTIPTNAIVPETKQ